MTRPAKTIWKLHDNIMLIDIDKLVSVADDGDDRSKVAVMLHDLTNMQS
jgi:hypothetical protein